ncbi:hypothetical protein Tco_0527206 [Tanacetum coccineum]
MVSASLICLIARATSTKSWLWHQRLSHLNFDTINKPKPVPNSKQRLHLLHMDMWGPIRVESINAIATACYTQNCSIIHRRFGKTPYELINDRKPNISFLHVFGTLYFPKNGCEDIGKLGAKGLDLTYAPSTITSQNPTERELELLFEAMYDDYFGGQSSAAPRTDPAALSPQVLHTPTASTTTTTDTTLTPTHSSS